MLFKKLGKTPVEVSAIGQGTGLGGYSSTGASYDDLPAVLRAGIDQGMTFIDTAPAYGDGASEIAVGRAIAGRRHEVVLATKVSPADVTRDGVMASVNASLRRLGTDYIDLYQVHWSNPTVPIAETMGAMAGLVQSGEVRQIGVSNFSLGELKAAEAALAPRALAATQVEYNLFDRSIEGALLPYCQQAGISVIAYSPLHRGRIASGARPLDTLGRIAAAHGRTVAQVALRWLIAHEAVVAIPNTSRMERTGLNAASADFDLAREEIDEIDRVCALQQKSVPTGSIKVSSDDARPSFRTLQDALDNTLGLAPSPKELAEQIRAGDFLKPIRLVRSRDPGAEYEVLEGRLRYWAWVIAHGADVPVPALIDGDD